VRVIIFVFFSLVEKGTQGRNKGGRFFCLLTRTNFILSKKGRSALVGRFFFTEIARGDGLKYALNYNAFHNLESIGINGKNDGDLMRHRGTVLLC